MDKSNLIKVNFSYNQIPLLIETDINDKISKIMNQYSSKSNMKLKSLIFLYNGFILSKDSFDKTIFEIINKQDKQERYMNILVYENESEILNENYQSNGINIMLCIDSKIIHFKGKKGDTLKNIFQRENSRIKNKYNQYSFYYKNREIDLNEKIEQIIDQIDMHNNIFIINAQKKEHKEKIIINFVNPNFGNTRIACYPDDNLENICRYYCSEKGYGIKNLIFKYKNASIDLNKNISQLYEDDQSQATDDFSARQQINEKGNIIKEISIKVINLIEMTQTQSNSTYTEDISCCERYKKLFIILSIILGILIIAGAIIVILIYIKNKKKEKNKEAPQNPENNDDINDLPNNPIIKKCDSGYFIPEDDSTLGDCQKCSLEGCIKCEGTYENNICTDCGDLKSVYDNSNIIIKCDKNLCDIGEEEKCLSCIEKKNECKTCNIGYILSDGKCKPDFFMKAVYYTKQKEDKIDIIRDITDVSHLYIEGEKIIPTSRSYQFKDEGYHIVYFQFRYTTYYASKLFYNNKHLKSATFSDFSDYIIDFSFSSFFTECTNLTSVDFSKMAYEIYTSTNSIFEGCINLTYVNISNLKLGQSSKYMFYNCKSLTSINLSKLDVSNLQYLDNMFENSISLQNINLKGFKLDKATSMSSMFKNCYSLKSPDLSAFKPPLLEYLNAAFYNCSSLTSINFLDFYSTEIYNMENLFYNCSSLKLLDLSDFNTKKVKYMDSLFEGCESLTSIIVGQNFEMSSNLAYVEYMFARCYSLKEINFNLVISNKITSLYSLFSDCHSLTSINLKNFDTSKVGYYTNMFRNCYRLTTIDISNLEINGLATNVRGMFSGCYLITSIDLSKMEINYYLYDEIFYDCPNLNYVDFSFLHYYPYYYSKKDYYLFNSNISENGTLILDEYYYNKELKELGIYPPKNWTLLLKN